MPVVGDIVQFTAVQTFLAQTILNVYFYRVVEIDPDASLQDLTEQFDVVVLDTVRNVQIQSLVYTNIVAKNLSDGLDIWDEVSAKTGEAVSVNTTPSFTALGFRLVRSTAATRHGSKRIAGVAEEMILGNELVSPWIANVAAMQDIFATNVVRDGTVSDFVLEPVIVGRFPLGHINEGKLNLGVINPVSASQFVRVTTQTTRRKGPGV